MSTFIMHPSKKHSLWHALGIWFCFVLPPSGHAQETADPRVPEYQLERLDALLRDLRALGPSIWEAKLARVERRIADHQARSALLRLEIARLNSELEHSEARSVEAKEELAELRTLAMHVHPMVIPAVAARRVGEKQAAPALAEARSTAPQTTPASTSEAVAVATPAVAKPASEAPPSLPPPNYEEHIRPLLEASCSACHDSSDARGGQDVSSYDALLRGGSSGATIVPGDADGSRLWRLVAHLEEPFMPKGSSQLAATELDLLKRWIDAGALRDAAAVTKKQAEATASSAKKAKEPSEAEAGTNTEGIAELTAPAHLVLDLPFHAVRKAEQAAPLIALAHSPTSPLLAAAGVDQVLLLHAETREHLAALPFDGRVTRLQFSRDGSRLLVAGGHPRSGGLAMLYDVATGDVLTSTKQGRDQLFAAALSPGQSVLAVGGPTRRVQALRTSDGENLYELRAHGDWILACTFSPDGNLLATADRGGAVLVWQADTGRDVANLRGHEGAVQALAFSPDAEVLVTLGEDGYACGWNCDRGNRLWRTRIASHGGTALAMGDDGNVLATAGNGALQRLRAKDGKAVGKAWPEWGTWIASLTISADGKHAFAGTASGDLVRLDLDQSKFLEATKIVPLEHRPIDDNRFSNHVGG